MDLELGVAKRRAARAEVNVLRTFSFTESGVEASGVRSRDPALLRRLRRELHIFFNMFLVEGGKDCAGTESVIGECSCVSVLLDFTRRREERKDANMPLILAFAEKEAWSRGAELDSGAVKVPLETVLDCIVITGMSIGERKGTLRRSTILI
jgi:hypothetical protein